MAQHFQTTATVSTAKPTTFDGETEQWIKGVKKAVRKRNRLLEHQQVQRMGVVERGVYNFERNVKRARNSKNLRFNKLISGSKATDIYSFVIPLTFAVLYAGLSYYLASVRRSL